MNKKLVGLIGAWMLVTVLNGAENETIPQLKARKAQLEKSYTASILKLASVLSGMASAATLGTAVYGVMGSIDIFSKMNASYGFVNMVDDSKKLLKDWSSSKPTFQKAIEDTKELAYRPTFWQVMQELYTKVLPDVISGAKVVPSKRFESTVSSIEKLSDENQLTLYFGFASPVLTTVGIVSAFLSRYLYKKAANYKKEIEKIDKRIAEISQQQ